MDSTIRFLSDLASWYWWLSVVFVGLIINLLSAYLKPGIDAWWSRQSARRRNELDKDKALFDQEVARLVKEPTLLLLEANRALAAEVQAFGTMALIGVDLALYYVLEQGKQPAAGAVNVLKSLLALALPFLLLFAIRFMAAEETINDRVKAARKALRDARD